MGLFGLGLGFAFGWAEFRTVNVVGWLLLLLSYWLIFRWGRRGRGGASATATAVAIATATSDAAATSQSHVNVFVAMPGASALDPRLDRLQSVSWRDETVDRQLEYQRAAEIAVDGDGDEDQVDVADPIELMERVRRGEPLV